MSLSPGKGIEAIPEKTISSAYASYLNIPSGEVVNEAVAGAIFTILGEVNNEARSIVVAATPQEWTPVQDIKAFLEERDAYKYVSPTRFKINSILRSAQPKLISYFSEPNIRKAWAKEDDGVFGTYANAMAGAFLRFSDEHGVSVRTLAGEKVAGTTENHASIEARLGVLATIVAFVQEDTPFSTTDLGERIEGFGFDAGTARNHVYRLRDAGYLQAHGAPNNRTYTTTERPDGSNAYDTIHDFLAIVGAFAICSPEAKEQGTQDAEDVLNDPRLLAELVDRSYKASAHTGKTFSRQPA